MALSLGVLLSLEIATRVDQRIQSGASLLGPYTYSSVLFTSDEAGIHGRPNAVYEKWSLNELGFRGPPARRERTAGVSRVVTLGASETFGLYESPGNEWPRQLERNLRNDGLRSEVLNAALAGMGFVSSLTQLEHRVLELDPDVVVVVLGYPQFANLTPERLEAKLTAPPRALEPPPRISLAPRLPRMLKDAVVPRSPKALRDLVEVTLRKLNLKQAETRLGPRFRSLKHLQPAEADAFLEVIRQFASLTTRRERDLVVVAPPLWLNERNLETFWATYPLVDESWLREAYEELVEIGAVSVANLGGRLVDCRGILVGPPERLMRDLVHFSDLGAGELANCLTRPIAELLGAQRRRGSGA